jgi:hypothetical protein
MDTNREKAAAPLASRQDEILRKVFVQWTEARAKAGLPAKNEEQRQLLKELGMAKTVERGEMRRQLARVERQVRQDEAKRETARLAELKKMKERLAQAEAADNRRALEAVEADMRRPVRQCGYELTVRERKIWLAAKARAHADD